jgi:tape measure domain-containing protein
MSGAVVSEMLIRIAADTAQLRSEMEGVKRQMGGGFDDIKNSAASLKSTLAGLVAGLSLGLVAKQFIETADAMALLDARLKQTVGGSGADYITAQKEIYRIAQANNAGLQETATLFTKMHEPVKRLGGGVKETAAIVDSFATSMRLGGASTQEASAATLQFAQAMGSGKLQGDEFRSLAEASPRFMKALADGMGVPIEKLKEMGTEGKLTADVVGNALMKELGNLKKEAGSMPDTVAGAFQRMKNDIMVAVNELNQNSGLTLGIAGLISGVNELVPTIKGELANAFQEVGSWIARNRADIIEIWEGTKGVLGDVWELAKGFASVLGFVAETVLQVVNFKTVLETVRFLIAGLQDGVKFIGAAFATLGSMIMEILVAPLQDALYVAAKVAGVFNGDLAKRITGISQEIADFAGRGKKYGGEVVDAFARGESAVAKLDAELLKANATGRDATKAAGALGSALGQQGKAADAAGGALTQLKNKNSELTKEQKEAEATYKKLITGIRDKTGALALEGSAQTKLTDAQKVALKVMQDIQNGTLKLTDAQKREVAAALEQLIATEKLNEERKDELALQKEMEAQRKRDIDALHKNADAIEELLRKQEDENYALRFGKEALAQLEIARLKDQRAVMAEIVAREELLGYCNDETEAHRRTLAALNDLIKAREQGVHLQAARDAADEWKKTADSIGDNLTDALMRAFESGKGFGQSLKDSLLNMFKTQVAKQVSSWMGSAIQSMFSSNSGGGGGGNMLSSLMSMFSSSGSGGGGGGFLSNIMSMFGSSSGGGASGGGGFMESIMSMFGSSGGASSGGGGFMNSIMSMFGSSGGGGAGGGMMAGGSMMGGIGGFGAGIGIGNTLSGSYSAIGSHKTTASAIGAGIGAIWGPIGSMIGGAIGGLVNRAFGRKPKEVKESGITGSFGGGSFGGQTYADWVKEGGWFRSDKHGTDYSALSDNVQTLLNTGGKAMLDSVTGLAKALKLPADDLAKLTTDVRVKMTGNAEEDQAAIESVLNQYRDKLAGQFQSVLTPFQKTGEALYDTLSRLAAVQLSREALNTFGGIFSKIATSGIDATEAMVKLAGGLDALVSKAQSFVENFYTQEEQLGMSARSLLEQLQGVGINTDGLNSKEAYRALVESLDVTQQAQREQLNALLTLGPQFAGLATYMQDNKLTLEQIAEAAPLVTALSPLFDTQTTAMQESTAAIDSTTVAVEGVTSAVEAGANATVDAINGLGGVIAQAVSNAASSSASAISALSSRLDQIETNNRLSQSAPY